MKMLYSTKKKRALLKIVKRAVTQDEYLRIKKYLKRPKKR
jgi:hypothetical protein